MEMYRDAYANYHETSFSELVADQEALEKASKWENASSLSVKPLATPMDVLVRSTDPTNDIPSEILYDTCENAGIMLEYDGVEACLRDCAIPSLLATAGISGGGVSRVEKEQLSVGLSAFLTGCRSASQILTRAGKVAAVVSARYEYMQISDMLRTCKELEQNFGPMEFRGGCVSHSLTAAEFAFPAAAPRITAVYQQVLTAHGVKPSATATPIIQFRASDTSGEAAKMYTFLKFSGSLFPLGGFSVRHIAPNEVNSQNIRMTCIEKFREEAGLVYAKMEYDIANTFPQMLSTQIHYPRNCFVGLCKYALIPQKWGGVMEMEVASDYPDGSDCTFADVYDALTRVTELAIKDGFKPLSQRVLDLEEGIAKVLNNHAAWTRYDLPGSVGWSK